MEIYMKKLLLTVLFIFSSFTYCLSDEIIISPNELPNTVKEFVQKFFRACEKKSVNSANLSFL